MDTGDIICLNARCTPCRRGDHSHRHTINVAYHQMTFEFKQQTVEDLLSTRVGFILTKPRVHVSNGKVSIALT